MTLGDTMAELTRLGADSVRAVVTSYVRAADRVAIDERAADPLVRDLQARMMDRSATAPTLQDLPPWFPSWALAVARTGKPPLARIAGLVLLQAGHADRQLAATLVLRAARATDLKLLSRSLDAPELQSTFAELDAAAGLLPVNVADALVAFAFPSHVDRPGAIGVLAEHLAVLQRLDVAPGGTIDDTIRAFRQMADERELDHDDVRPLVADLLAEARRHAGRLRGAAAGIRMEDVERTVARLPVLPVTAGVLELGAEAAMGQPPLEGLLVLLALRAGVAGTRYETHWSPPLAKKASDAIYALRVMPIFKLRLRLLSEAIEADHPMLSVAELYYHRGNTRRALSQDADGQTDLVLADLQTARDRARVEGNARLCAEATAAWAKMLAWQARDANGAGDLKVADQAIAETLSLPLDRFSQATLHQARAHLVRLTGLADSLVHFESAVALVDADAPFWAELAAEIVEVLMRIGQASEAVRRGRAFLGNVSSDTPPAELGMLRLTVGAAMIAVGEWSAARAQLDEGLTLARGQSLQHEVLGRMNLVRLGLVTTDHALAEEHLRFLADHRGELDPQAQVDLLRLEASAAAARGDLSQQVDLLAKATTAALDAATRIGLSLEHARLRLANGDTVADLDALILRAFDAELGEQHLDVLVDLICNHDAPLAAATIATAISWARQRGAMTTVARLLSLAGQADEARATLRAALADEPNDPQRFACTHLLMTMLVSGDHSERRELCAELERLVDTVGGRPDVRLDLAAGLHMTAGDDTPTLRRAREHALRALETVRDSRATKHGQRLLGQIAVDLLRHSSPQSSPAVAEDAMPLMRELLINESEAMQLRLAAAVLLLWPGPLAHPDVLDVAESLLRLAAVHDHSAAGPLTERLSWIRRRIEPDQRTRVVGPEPSGPFDGMADWVIDAVNGRRVAIGQDDLGTAPGMVVRLVQVRPDAADGLLARVLSVQHELAPSVREELLDAVYTAVQVSDRDGWPLVRRALTSVPEEHGHPMLMTIWSATERASTTDGPPPSRAAEAAKDPEPVDIEPKGRQRALKCFERGVSLMEELQLDPFAKDADQRIRKARAVLAEAVAIAQARDLPELFDLLVSQGNAWRAGPEEDLDRALRIYEYAATMAAPPQQRAKLW